MGRCEELEAKIKIYKLQKRDRVQVIQDVLFDEEKRMLTVEMHIEDIRAEREKMLMEKETIARNQKAQYDTLCGKLDWKEQAVPELREMIVEMRLKAENKMNYVDDKAKELKSILRGEKS